MTYFKAFDKNFECLGFQYREGETYEIRGELRQCKNGFHACKDPFDVLNYYPLASSRFAIVDLKGNKISSQSKVCAEKIQIEKELSLDEFIREIVTFQMISGDYSKHASTGNYSKHASTGNYSKHASTGDGSEHASTGNDSVLFPAGKNSRIKGKNGDVFALCHYRRSGYKPINVVSGIIGQDGIKEDIWYMLNSNGKLIEAGE